MIIWRIYYSDGTHYDNLSGGPEDAPARDVQVVAVADYKVGVYFLTGHDYYIFQDGVWFGVDRFGLFDYLIEPGWKRVLFGRTIRSAEYDMIVRAALADPDLPHKSSHLVGERVLP